MCKITHLIDNKKQNCTFLLVDESKKIAASSLFLAGSNKKEYIAGSMGDFHVAINGYFCSGFLVKQQIMC